MLKPISSTRLEELCANYRNNKSLLNETNAVFITKKHLSDFVDGLPQPCDAVKICFVRFSSTPPDPVTIKDAGNNLTQVSLIFVPLSNTNSATWESTEIAGENSLCVCEPTVDDTNSTGVCPPKKGCPT